MRSWAPFGGPPQEEILPLFGLTCPEFDQRFRDIIASLQARTSVLAEADKELLVTVQRTLAEHQTACTNR
ncbi:hypothetical protein ACNUDN_25250 [Mycobacterium sp. smrl_JER01]|uniref:hypothetical protein n=1 Tax=Mycobacterium sp. smrl_JER01 TaxID=3402633 RepID=UPI003ACA1C43